MKNVYEMFLLDPSNFYLGDENEVKMTDKLPWKSVNDHPLPEGDGKQYFCALFSDGLFASINHPARWRSGRGGRHGSLTHWFELTPPEEELSFDEKLKGEALDALNRVKDKSILKGQNFDDVYNFQAAIDAAVDTWAEEAKKLDANPVAQPKENITPSEKHQMDIVDKFQKFREKFWEGFELVPSPFDQSEKQPQEPKQTIELWSVWQRTGTDGIFVVTKKTNEFFPRVGLWNITMSQHDDLYFFSDFKRDFTPRPDLEVSRLHCSSIAMALSHRFM